MTVYITVGISGSGKSHVARNLFPDAIELNADNIRKEISGDISCQSQNSLVFKMIDDRLEKAIKDGTKDVIISNTNLHLDKNIELALKYPDTKFMMLLIEDSSRFNRCVSRVKKDLKNKVERSDVPVFVIRNQHKNFIKLVEDLKTTELPENLSYKWVTSDLRII